MLNWELVVVRKNRGKTWRICISKSSMVYSALLLMFLCVCFAGFIWRQNTRTGDESKIAILEEQLRMKETQLTYFAERMSQIRSELSQIRKVSSEIEQKLGRQELKEEGGLGGPSQSLGGNSARVAYLLPENEMLDQMWSEIQDIEQETKLEKGRNASLNRFLSSQGALVRAVPNMRPIDGGYISSLFGRREDPFTGAFKMHTGVDFAHSNRVSVYATAEGIVTQTTYNPTYGNLVAIYHGFGISTWYAHLHNYKVSIGDWVERGQIIGKLGNTGRSTHRHLHYEVRIEGRPVNPGFFLPVEDNS